MTRHSLSAVSFRDPGGFVYEDQGCILRQVNFLAREHYDQLMKSGLYRELTERRLLIAHDEVDALPRVSATAYRVIRPEPVSLISYPFEWSFSQYRDAALLTLAVERQALRRGMSLKDCSAYNVQFHEGQPIFIDTLSLEQYHEGRPWVAYRQFCQHFLAPLALMSLTDIRLGQLCRTNLDGIPLDLATRLLPWRSRVRFGLSLHLHLHGLVQHSDAQTRESGSPGRFQPVRDAGAHGEPRVHRERALLEAGSVDLGRLLEGVDVFTRPDRPEEPIHRRVSGAGQACKRLGPRGEHRQFQRLLAQHHQELCSGKPFWP